MEDLDVTCDTETKARITAVQAKNEGVHVLLWSCYWSADPLPYWHAQPDFTNKGDFSCRRLGSGKDDHFYPTKHLRSCIIFNLLKICDRICCKV